MNKRNIIWAGFMALGLFSVGYIVFQNMNLNEVGLTMLSWVKKVRGQSVDVHMVEKQSTPLVNHQIWTELLVRYVDEDGKVSYASFMDDREKLGEYLEVLSNHPPGENWTEVDRLAYWINAYNAFTVKLILDHYPLKSIKDISDGLPMINSPWDIKFFKIGDTPMDLNTIEHEILRKEFAEPRIHFAINCASVSCPKLRNEAFTAQKLEAQLEDQAFAFMHDPDKNLIDESETKLSPIFSWFEHDFTKQTDLLSFIQAYNATLNKQNKVAYLEYDWGLNE